MPSHYLKQCWYFVNWILRSKLHWNFNQNTNLFIHENAFKISSAERRPFCPGGTELTGTDYKTATKQSIANLVDIIRVTLCLVLLMKYMALEIESCHNATGCHNLRCHQWNPLFTNGVASYDKVGMMTAVTLTSGPAKGDKVGTMAIFSFTHRAAKVGISVGFQCTFATILFSSTMRRRKKHASDHTTYYTNDSSANDAADHPTFNDRPRDHPWSYDPGHHPCRYHPGHHPSRNHAFYMRIRRSHGWVNVLLNTWRLRQNNRHFGDIFKYILLTENVRLQLKYRHSRKCFWESRQQNGSLSLSVLNA